MALTMLMMAVGVIAIWIPVIAGITVTAIVAWLLVFSGVLHIAFAWRADRRAAVLWEILLGIVYGSIGLYLLARPVTGLASLTLAIAFYLLIKGVLEFALALQLRAERGGGWLLADRLITLVLATMIWSTSPSSAEWVVGTVVGISMFFSGITRLMLSMTERRIMA
jgi:uncharacterized membrane protein HdeD (DUF308 family)